MPLLPFKRKNMKPIRRGLKRQTIRKKRKKNPIKPGDMLYCWADCRTKRAEKIGQYICRSITPVEIHVGGYILDGKISRFVEHREELTRFANLDGFETWEELVEFFSGYYGMPMTDGVVIEW